MVWATPRPGMIVILGRASFSCLGIASVNTSGGKGGTTFKYIRGRLAPKSIVRSPRLLRDGCLERNQNHARDQCDSRRSSACAGLARASPHRRKYKLCAVDGAQPAFA